VHLHLAAQQHHLLIQQQEDVRLDITLQTPQQELQVTYGILVMVVHQMLQIQQKVMEQPGPIQ